MEQRERDQLTEHAERLLRKCGSHAELVIETSLLCDEVQYPVLRTGRLIAREQKLEANMLYETPLMRALQVGAAECRCSPLGQLTVQSTSISGSQLEGVNQWQDIDGSKSDLDVMHELGPVQWMSTATQNWPAAAEAESEAAARLTVIPTDIPGFVRVLQVQRPDCQHQEPLPFLAASIRQLWKNFLRMIMKPDVELSVNGPAVNCSTDDDPAGDDYVPCLRAPGWPIDEFLTRQRECDWPPAAAREDMGRFGVHLVPIGYRGSVTEQTEWRLSFSRVEVVASWHLNRIQKQVLRALKACRTCLGVDGKGLKSYYMKTALFWLCEEKPSEHWRGVMQGSRWVLERLEKAVDARRLPCFFWADVNLLQPLTPEELETMQRTIGLMRSHLTRLMMRSRVEQNNFFLQPLLIGSDELLTEHQVRVCLARGLVKIGVEAAISLRLEYDHFVHIDQLIPVMLRSSAAAELAQFHTLVTDSTRLHLRLWQAMLVAPDDVVGAMRLERRGEHDFTWDAAPLMALLTAEDVKQILYQPAAVRSWWQQHRPPTLPDDPLSLRGLAQLVTDTRLLIEVLSRSVHDFRETLQRKAEALRKRSARHPLETYEEAWRSALAGFPWPGLASRLQRLEIADKQTAQRMAALWHREMLRHWTDPDVRAEYERIRTSLPDPWRLRPFLLL